MRVVAAVMLTVGLIGISSGVRADEKGKDLVVGTWQITYSDAQESIPVGPKLEFTANGKVTVTVTEKDGKPKTSELGGYKIDRDYLILTGKDGNRNDKARICLLNKTSFVINDEVADKLMVLKRVKAK